MECVNNYYSTTVIGNRRSHSGKPVDYGYVSNQAGSSFPYIDNQYFLHLTDQFSLDESFFFDDYFERYDRYKDFIQARTKRPYFDAYSSYQPFNESFKSLYPFIKIALEQIDHGKPILNLWDRNGWTTALLLGVFPHNPIYTIWEGNKDVLGYQGYAYWFGENPNLKVLFCELDKELPLRDGFFDLVIGYDVLHRYELNDFLSEIQRITSETGALIFPHVHLSNDVPSPFFERGGIQMHGLEYQRKFDNADNNDRSGYVFSEPELFVLNDLSSAGVKKKMLSQPNTKDYNALVSLLPKSWQAYELSSFRLTDFAARYDSNEIRILLNPLYELNLSHGLAQLQSSHNEIKKLLNRHPIYKSRLQQQIRLTPIQTIAVYLGQLGYTIEEVTAKSQQTLDIILDELTLLEDMGLIQCIPLSKEHMAMQMFIGTQKSLAQITSLDWCWTKACQAFSDHDYISSFDGSIFTYEEIDELVQMTAQSLRTNYVKGDKLAIISEPHLESIVLFWAAMLNGMVLVPINKSWKNEMIELILGEVQPKIVFVSESNRPAITPLLKSIDYVVFDSDGIEDDDEVYFSVWMESHEETDEAANLIGKIQLDPSDLAVVLYTSGSTGKPKGVQLDHEALYWSGLNMSTHFDWQTEDKYFCNGGLEFMSGLRNATTAAALTGCSIYIPDPESQRSMVKMADEVTQSHCTIIATNPRFLTGLLSLSTHISLNDLRLVLCTGNLLTQDLKEKFFESYSLPIINYYGHTETAGICAAQSAGNQLADTVCSIGNTVNAVIQIVDENDKIITNGQMGQLRIFSPSLSSGYLNHPSDIRKHGWYYTGDLGCINKRGSIEFIGRKREIFKTPNEQIIYLAFVEQCLGTLKWIRNVIAHSHYVNGIEQLILFVETEAGVPDDSSAHIRQTIHENVTNETIPTAIIYDPNLTVINGKISKDTLVNEMRNRQVI